MNGRGIRQVFAALRFCFSGFFSSSRTVLAFLAGVWVCFLLSGRVIQVAEEFGTPLQLGEVFIWTFGDAQSVLFASLLLLLLFSDVPKISPATPYYLLRMTKGRWLAAQVLYVAGGTFLYVAAIMGLTMGLCLQDAFLGNQWSETAAILGYSDLGEELSVAATVKVMESVTPYGCLLQAAGLFFGYSLFLGMLILLGNLLGGRQWGLGLGLGMSLYGFLLDPEVLGKLLGLEDFEMYRVRVAVGWLSPLNHGVYGSHNFGYDLLPTVGASLALLLGLSAAAVFGAYRRLGRCQYLIP